MAFQKQERPPASVKSRRECMFHNFLRLTISRAVVLALLAVHDAHQHLRAIRRNRGNGRNAAEEQDAVRTGISDARKVL
jgi:hypothetical protein